MCAHNPYRKHQRARSTDGPGVTSHHARTFFQVHPHPFVSFLEVYFWGLLAVQWLRVCLAMSGTQVQSLVVELRSHVPHSNHVKGIPYDATEAQRSQIKKDLSYNVIEKVEASKSKHSHIPTLAFSLFICFEKCLRTSIRAGQWATLWFRSGENLSQLHQCPKDQAQNEAQNFPRGWHLGNACLRETSGYYKFCDTFPPHKTQDETHTSLETTQGGPLTSP